MTTYPFTITDLSLEQLHDLSKDTAKLIMRKENENETAALDAARKAAAQHGFDLDKIHGTALKKTAAYMNPQDHTQTWSGRGRRPKWLTEALSKGKTLEDFRP